MSRLTPERLRRTLGAARCVTSPLSFAVRDLRSARSIHTYRLRGSGLAAAVRHPLLDMWAIEEMFRFGEYAFPGPVSQALAAVDRPLRIVDVGGHAGYFGLFARSRFPDAHVLSFEPDPDNLNVLRRNIEANDLADRWEVIEAAAGTADGTAAFDSSFHLSRVVASEDQALAGLQEEIGEALPFLQGTALLQAERLEVQVRDVFDHLGAADLVKLDAEGAEWEVLGDSRFAGIPARAVVVEYHPSYTDAPDAEGHVRQLLEAGGFRTGHATWGGQAGTVWAWRP